MPDALRVEANVLGNAILTSIAIGDGLLTGPAVSIAWRMSGVKAALSNKKALYCAFHNPGVSSIKALSSPND